MIFSTFAASLSYGAVLGSSTGTTFVRLPDGSEARFTFLVRTTATDLLYELQRSLPGVGPWVTIGDVNLECLRFCGRGFPRQKAKP